MRTILFALILLFSFSPSQAQSFKIKPIQNQVVAYPNAMLLPFSVTGDVAVTKLTFTYQSDIDGAIIRGQSIYWKPNMDAVGRHRVKIIATAPGGETATETFKVKVASFNAPPRFVPTREISIPVGYTYTLPITAIDPDGMNKNLVRYLGVNLPKGATINEETGKLTWSPTERQIGKNTFRVIATDQYGAASSVDVTIRVVNLKKGDE